MKQGGRLFDIITCDPPWKLSSANPTRGVAIAYDTLADKQILELPFDKLQVNGYLFIWVINAKYRLALEMFEKFGYKLVDEIVWVKQTVNGKIAKGHGYYLQHSKETCLIGVKGNVAGRSSLNIACDVIFSQRRGQSQKPEEIYDIAESLMPNGFYLEIFGRRNNLHDGWVTIGNEL
uniref:mRNA m(6)A methyltransferase n=1 Tax=Strombidium rassoulzadegani TaxID=1082188 RepID=A0A7S3FZ16_9SPIT|mmetsp:Transcript_3889/g.6610  ORF Transcript_3889/g.6610 Transcript_3889/m.6610 type:complete len:177 (+) Transcript_3889:295-825(+)